MPFTLGGCGKIPFTDDDLGIGSMPEPVFSDTTRVLPYGSPITFYADSMPSPGIYEFSLDNGKNWQTGNSVVLEQSSELWIRTRYKKVFSNINKTFFSIYYRHVIVVGNSITSHGPLPDKGWFGNWGMAASSQEQDYFHQIAGKLKTLYPAVEITVAHDVAFEQNYQNYQYENLKYLIDLEPDLIIMRIGENVSSQVGAEFENSYAKYIKTLTTNRKVKVICTTSFWSTKSEVSKKIMNVANTNGYLLVDLQPLSNDSSYSAFKFFKDPGIAAHPSDKGMKAIANLIGEKL